MLVGIQARVQQMRPLSNGNEHTFGDRFEVGTEVTRTLHDQNLLLRRLQTDMWGSIDSHYAFVSLTCFCVKPNQEMGFLMSECALAFTFAT